MEQDLPQLPPLEDILRAVAGNNPGNSRSLDNQEGKAPKIKSINCPILRRKTGRDAEIHITEFGVVCEYHVTERGQWSHCNILAEKIKDAHAACQYSNLPDRFTYASAYLLSKK